MDKKIGSAIARLRKEKGMTLQTMAELSGLTKGYLSKVERGLNSPPVSTLSRVAKALGADLSDFFDPAKKEKRFTLIHPEERQPIAREGRSQGYQYEALAFLFGRKIMEPFLITFSPHPSDTQHFTHEGEEVIFVLEGQIRFFWGEDEHICQAGDCLYFDSSIPHRGEAYGDEQAKVLMIMASKGPADYIALDRPTPNKTP